LTDIEDFVFDRVRKYNSYMKKQLKASKKKNGRKAGLTPIFLDILIYQLILLGHVIARTTRGFRIDIATC
jgi:hypothetical protein